MCKMEDSGYEVEEEKAEYGARNYRDLVAWQKAMDLVEIVYRLTQVFPKEEVYGLTSQARRAAVSVPANIAEGQGRKTPGDFGRFLAIAHGSLRELETHLLIAQRLHYLEEAQTRPAFALCEETGRLINGLLRSLRS